MENNFNIIYTDCGFIIDLQDLAFTWVLRSGPQLLPDPSHLPSHPNLGLPLRVVCIPTETPLEKKKKD